ncbi:MAG: glycosyltransferase family 2 protein [Flavobacteriales bacterium]|nr:glycosyltransferase family 2 protein [Flavobacteriales bacterium]
MKVSIVLPCHNAEGHLERCLNSLFEQTHRPLELIAVDDGSTDATKTLLEAAMARCPYPMQVLSQANAGACAARNTGLHAARGVFVQFMDADDELMPMKIAHQVSICDADARPDAIAGRVRTRLGNGAEDRLDRPFSSEDSDEWLALMRHRLGRTSSLLLARDAVLRAGGWDIQAISSQEYELLFAMLKQGARVVHDNEALTLIHRRSGSISMADPGASWKRFIDLRVKILRHVEQFFPERDPQPYRQALFDGLRTLHAFSPSEAERLYRQEFATGFTPGQSPATGRFYLLLHRAFGFAYANRIRRGLSALG